MFILFFLLFRAALEAYGGSQARSGTGAAAAGLHHSHSSVESGPPLTYTTAHSSNTRSLTHCVRPGIEPATSWFAVRFVSAAPQWELQKNGKFFKMIFTVLTASQKIRQNRILERFLTSWPKDSISNLTGVAQWKWIWLVSMRTQVRSLASRSGLRIWCCYELWCRL